MKIVRIWADINSTGLFDEEGNIILQDETTINDVTWKELQKWVNDYEFIVPLTLNERAKVQGRIEELDGTGIKLLNIIRNEWDTDIKNNETIKFKYYSEGLMKYLL